MSATLKYGIRYAYFHCIDTEYTRILIVTFYQILQQMNSTKALTQLGFLTARGLDNGEHGALLLSNKVFKYFQYDY